LVTWKKKSGEGERWEESKESDSSMVFKKKKRN